MPNAMMEGDQIGDEEEGEEEDGGNLMENPEVEAQDF